VGPGRGAGVGIAAAAVGGLGPGGSGGGGLGEGLLALRDDVGEPVERVRGGRQVPRGPGGGLAEHLGLAAQAGAELGEVAAVGLQHGLGLRGERLDQAAEAPPAAAAAAGGGGGSGGLRLRLLLRWRGGRVRIGLGEDGLEEIHGGLDRIGDVGRGFGLGEGRGWDLGEQSSFDFVRGWDWELSRGAGEGFALASLSLAGHGFVNRDCRVRVP